MNAGRAIRHLEQVGFTHEQATGVIEIMQEEVLDTLATRDFVALACERVKDELRADLHAVQAELKGDIHDLRAELKGDIHDLRSEVKGDIHGLALDFRDRHITLIKWLAGVAIMQTASIIFGTVGLIELLR